MKVLHRAQPGWGVGHVVAVSEDAPRLSAQFPGRGEVILSSRDPQLVRFRFAPGSPVLLVDGTAARVLRPLPGGAGDFHRYTVEAAGKKPQVRSEADLRAVPPRAGPAEQLASGRWGAPEDFELRAEAVRLDLERRADALGALFASRVYVKPHQVSVAHHVLSAAQPRFVLADEVGLGKTIEAGLVLSAMLHAGLVRRCLVVAPSHLTVQWLAELFHKFNLLFTLMDPDRARDARQEAPDPDAPGSPWARHNLVVTSLEWLSRAGKEAEEAAAAGWDLVVFDEAHHLRGARAYEVANALSRASWGLLLLTATPLQLDPGEYHALLRRKRTPAAGSPAARSSRGCCGTWEARPRRCRPRSLPQGTRRSGRSRRAPRRFRPRTIPSCRRSASCSTASWPVRRCWCSPRRARRSSTCGCSSRGRRGSARASRRWRTPETSPRPSGTSWWRVSAIPRGRACCSAPSWAERVATSSTVMCS